MFCPKCGNELPDTAAFCNACGATVEKKAPAAESATKPDASAPVVKSGFSVNPIVIGAIAAVVVLVVVLVVAVGSCSSSNGKGSTLSTTSSSTTTSSASYSSNASSSASQKESTDFAEKLVGTWRDADYGDTMELNANGLCIINQKGHGSTAWQWETEGNGIRISDGSKSYVLNYGYVNGKETLYNNSKGLKFQR